MLFFETQCIAAAIASQKLVKYSTAPLAAVEACRSIFPSLSAAQWDNGTSSTTTCTSTASGGILRKNSEDDWYSLTRRRSCLHFCMFCILLVKNYWLKNSFQIDEASPAMCSRTVLLAANRQNKTEVCEIMQYLSLYIKKNNVNL